MYLQITAKQLGHLEEVVFFARKGGKPEKEARRIDSFFIIPQFHHIYCV